MRCAISPNDPRIADLVRALDHDEQPAAETWRLVSAAAERLGLRRPSYGHVRRLVRIERALQRLRAEARAILTDAGVAFLAGRVPPVLRVIEEVTELRHREELVFQEHKPPPDAS
ncbi:MAG: hypothetical protein H0V45_13025 [Actinobacteria bacterium]|nr:hypothetical protein [Actinomycetota bacterium]